jgi:hypothetical protein
MTEITGTVRQQALKGGVAGLRGESAADVYRRTVDPTATDAQFLASLQGAGTAAGDLSNVSNANFLSKAVAAGLLKAGKTTIPVMAGAMTARTTNGAAAGTTETTTNKLMLRTLDFDASTAEYAQILVPMPKSWNEGTVTAQFLWGASATGNVVWAVQAVAISDDDVFDAAFGTAVKVTDGVTATTDLMISAETGAITVAGTPADGDLVCFQFYRDATNASDTCAVDAKLVGVRLFITLNAADDT